MTGDAVNLPQMNRIGRPQINCAILNMGRAWQLEEVGKQEHFGEGEFNYKNSSHIEHIVNATYLNLLQKLEQHPNTAATNRKELPSPYPPSYPSPYS